MDVHYNPSSTTHHPSTQQNTTVSAESQGNQQKKAQTLVEYMASENGRFERDERYNRQICFTFFDSCRIWTPIYIYLAFPNIEKERHAPPTRYEELVFWHTVTSFTKAQNEGYAGIADPLLKFDRYKVQE
ncbi:hypothetical protein LTR99_010478 [Exophiala xenobiotica]|uniref:Uncharacterized protein n=1 Tax=Vermiconidia calcicola TaxID=1690605 RepID=A0AAV9PVT5_9PEZI|nr:hypothetical protein LTR92_007569 [Exophiala xenobiotica]KAK5528635.1 hypothetical protein LTR25_010248 [Vermiconidia calcicola]KAK5546059.1 hypothetical protein LTR23_003866 [Chaetothyriales sp. CCFEE 6169]KAK5207594.1 hypothetical protein LTR41_006638 [Exophiala xenobiotica]KAK5220619.1 hypothetical protein LTR72_007241 [Exophiala xenobiotica]